ncbi:MAG: nucleotidyl transferase AbiEii/AbiGii toxin family protein [Actinomycetota bacterium]
MNSGSTDAQIIESFHLAFLQVLQARLDQARYVVKGGANLRYFFESVRYSEDIDFDAIEIEPWKIQEKIDEVLASPAMGFLLRSCAMTLEEVTKHKQADTTQRWKTLISVGGREIPVRTKIEFSHRPSDARRILDAVPDRVVAPYALRAPTMLHYTADAAIEQKVKALALRSQTQARDVFDLELLFRTHRDTSQQGEIEPNIIKAAVDRASGLSFEDFREQVVPFLDPEVAELHDDQSAWKQMQTFVAKRLSELQ